ncbi:MAG: 4-alpha-glucanotransferase, partial [Oscillospiraceae bacterium]|nr:4-alpha-glucanotransferase [Oscillospiraceae bacterium]
SAYLPHNCPEDCIMYTGTHDNDTAEGWYQTASPEAREKAAAYLGLHPEEGYNWGMMRAVWSSVAELAVVQAQDLLGIGSEGRMNTPSSVGKNWRWRALPGGFTPQLAARMRANMELFRRLPE